MNSANDAAETRAIFSDSGDGLSSSGIRAGTVSETIEEEFRGKTRSLHRSVRDIDRHGAKLLVPKIALEGWWTSLPETHIVVGHCATSALRSFLRYTHRVAISNSRLVARDQKVVTIRVGGYRVVGTGRTRAMTLAPAEFIRRFILHLLPSWQSRALHGRASTASGPMPAGRRPREDGNHRAGARSDRGSGADPVGTDHR